MSNICEHDYLRRECPVCEEIAQLKRENEQLRVELDRLKRGGWISVKERQPEKGKRILVCIQTRFGPEIDIRRHLESGRFVHFNQDGMITHWMPLPEPPEEQ